MKFGLIGTFDVDNYGDCMFPELYAHLIRTRFGDVEITLYSPSSKAAEILSFATIHALPTVAELDALSVFDDDVLLLVGGEVIGYGHNSGIYNFRRNTLSALLRLWLAPLLAARADGPRPTFFAAHAVGAKTMPDKINALIAQCLAAADRVRFRDEFSNEWIKTEDVQFDVDVDPMFLISHLCAQQEWVDRAQAHLPDTLKPNGYLAAQLTIRYGGNDFAAWAKAIGQISRDRGLPVLLVPICHFLDDERLLNHVRPLLEAEGVETYLAKGRVNVKDTAALVGLSAGYIGSSLHGAVTAVSFGKPVAVLGHSPDGKHAGTLASVGLTGVVTQYSADLPGCFAHALKLDWDGARQRSATLARASIDALFAAIETSQTEARTDNLQASSEELIAIERKPELREDFKKMLQRIIRVIPKLSNAYSAWRIKKLFQDL